MGSSILWQSRKVIKTLLEVPIYINMEKGKLSEKRKAKGLSQSDIANKLGMVVSNYSRRESGETKISWYEWEKLAQILDANVEDIFEPEESQVFICKDNTTVNYQGTNVIYSIPEYILETQRRYIEKLENEIHELKQLLEGRKG